MGMTDMDWIFQISQAGDKDVDPVGQIFEQRVLALRRALARKTNIRSKVMKIISLYGAADEVSDGEGNTIPMDQPAPHPNLAARSRWMKTVRPQGPIGLLIQALRCIGAQLDENGCIQMQGETPIDIESMPYQALGRTVMLIDKARKLQEGTLEKGTRKRPLKKPFSLQSDGDLW